MKEFIVAMIIVLIALVLVYGPLAVIWALNTLFQLTIPYTFKTWAAALLLSSLVGARASVQTGKK